MPENKLTLANLAEGFRLFNTGCDLYLFIFLAAPGLHCYVRAFSSWSEQWLPLAAVVGLPLLQLAGSRAWVSVLVALAT